MTSHLKQCQPLSNKKALSPLRPTFEREIGEDKTRCEPDCLILDIPAADARHPGHHSGIDFFGTTTNTPSAATAIPRNELGYGRTFT